MQQAFAFLGTTVQVTSDQRAILEWLDEFLAPAFASPARADADHVVAIVHDPARVAMVAGSRPPGTLPTAPCFVRDEKLTRRPIWHWRERTVLAEDRLGALYVLAGSDVEVLATPGSPRLRTAAMRVVRELALAPAFADPRWLSLHASGLVHEGAGVLFAGPRTCGKTTMLAYVAQAARAAILANDRVSASADGDGWELRGVPTIVSVRAGTLALLPAVRDRLPAGALAVERTLAEDASGVAAHAPVPPDERRPEERRPEERRKISPAQLAAALGVGRAARARLAAIAFPDPDGGDDEVTVERLSPAHASARLRDALFARTVRRDAPTIFAALRAAARPIDADEDGLARLAARMPCFAVHVGARAFRDSAAAEEVLRRLLA